MHIRGPTVLPLNLFCPLQDLENSFTLERTDAALIR
jgi:hypothetical protein